MREMSIEQRVEAMKELYQMECHWHATTKTWLHEVEQMAWRKVAEWVARREVMAHAAGYDLGVEHGGLSSRRAKADE